MKKFFVFALTILLAGSTQAPTVFAATPADDSIAIEHNSDGGTRVKVKHKGTSFFKATESGEHHQALALAGGEWAALATNLSRSAHKALAVVASGTEISAAWELPNPAVPSTLTVDGDSVTSGDGSGNAQLSALDSNRRHRVTVSQEWLVNASAKLGEPDYALSHIETISIDVVKPAAMTFQAATAAVQTSAVSLPTKTVVRYQTFIKDNFVAVPTLGCPFAPAIPLSTGLFQGNGRSFDPSSNEIKTQQIVTIDWTGSSSHAYKRVGATNLWYASVFSGLWQQGSKQEPASSLFFDALTPVVGGQFVFRIVSHAANPYCPGVQPIYYDFTGSVSRSGGYDFTGEYRRVPNHEFYIGDDVTNSWSTIMQGDIDAIGFGCLVPLVDCVSKDLHLVRP